MSKRKSFRTLVNVVFFLFLLTLFGYRLYYSFSFWFTAGDSSPSNWVLENSLVVAELAVAPGLQIADVGCGKGTFAADLADFVGPKGKIYCVDIDPSALQFARDLAQLEGLHNFTTILSTPTDPMLPPDSLDMVTAVNAYHEFHHYQSMLAGIKRALRRGGILGIVEAPSNNPAQPHEFYEKEHMMAEDVLKKELETAGFRFIRSTVVSSRGKMLLYIFVSV